MKKKKGIPLLSTTPLRHLSASAPASRRVVPARRGGPVKAEANLFARAVRVFKSYANAIGEFFLFLSFGQFGHSIRFRSTFSQPSSSLSNLRETPATIAHNNNNNKQQTVSAAEDPEKMLDQTVSEMQNDLIRMRQASAQVLASQKQVEAKYAAAEQTADEWYRRAELALEKGDEELAREALKRRKAYADNAAAMKSQVEAQRKAVEQLIGSTRALEAKLVEAKSKKDTLKARAKSAAATKQVAEMTQGLNTSNAVVAFERMEEKVLALEGEAEATAQLVAPDDLEKKFASLEGGSVDDDLAKLKAGVLKSGTVRPVGTLPEGRPIRDAIDMELEDLRRKAAE